MKLNTSGYNIGHLNVQTFVKSDRPNQFPGLTIKYIQGKDPTVHLMDDDRNIVETLGIEKWNTDSIEAFFHERVKK
ncbi:hypothetical protein ACJMK2_040158 [Sinanodonta woodiana]|uniref:Selenoprotein F n=1 Tax=Sinanodonta woodiana TaxID=1069815 RepID=A0ABD3WFC3_SINWO